MLPVSMPPAMNEKTDSPFRPALAIALGDPAGIGPEVILKALADPALKTLADLTVVGDRTLLTQTYEAIKATCRPEELIHPESLNIVNVDYPPGLREHVTAGQENAASGEISFRCMETAIAHTLAGKFQGIVTAPIAKSAWKAAGHVYPGQT